MDVDPSAKQKSVARGVDFGLYAADRLGTGFMQGIDIKLCLFVAGGIQYLYRKLISVS